VTRAQARQMVSHKSIEVNGKVVNIPSYQVQPEDRISVREKARKQLRIQESIGVARELDLVPAWIDVDFDKMEGVFKAVPDRDELPPDINENLIVELYSK
jgi:small subunit ribosomal protein S4